MRLQYTLVLFRSAHLLQSLVLSFARRSSIGLGALALAVGAAACGGDDGQESAPEQDPGVEESAPEEDEQLDPGDGDEPQSDAGEIGRASCRERGRVLDW